ncbi:ribosome maturation factor RimM [Dictyobacter kobayashii]|uniref:Ribosome maturation factor RimM n=1 Tax=Dictyobacter kobayashii TaxID=2014872 RepID=A0A402AN97_9CHLR|nr:ribosome maturation factor RimM [Dictyobacter kobayashii]GCE20668.1 ribosome maturation factor RimM [Dictyobacter kobayashii]
MKNTTEWATIGKIVAPFGIRGEVKVFSLSDVPNRFVKLTAIYLAPDQVRYPIESVRPYKGEMLLLKFKGIDDANAAEKLRNRDIVIPLDELAQLPPDSYYQHDILGLQVVRLNGQEVGTIVDIWATGGNDVYVIKGTQGQQFLIPAIKEVIKQIDLIRHVMYIDPMKGLLDDEAVMDDPNQEEVE